MRYKDFCLKETIKPYVKINVWYCFSASGVEDLLMIDGNMEQKQYK